MMLWKRKIIDEAEADFSPLEVPKTIPAPILSRRVTKLLLEVFVVIFVVLFACSLFLTIAMWAPI